MPENQPQFTQLQEQYKLGFGSAEEVPATVLVERTNGQIDTAHVYSGSEVAYLEPGQEYPQKPVTKEALSDEVQEELARKLAGVALRGEAGGAKSGG